MQIYYKYYNINIQKKWITYKRISAGIGVKNGFLKALREIKNNTIQKQKCIHTNTYAMDACILLTITIIIVIVIVCVNLNMITIYFGHIFARNIKSPNFAWSHVILINLLKHNSCSTMEEQR